MPQIIATKCLFCIIYYFEISSTATDTLKQNKILIFFVDVDNEMIMLITKWLLYNENGLYSPFWVIFKILPAENGKIKT